MSSTTPEADTVVLTVEEAGAILRISRNTAYAMARLWLESDGREGLPVIALGRSLRVPRDALLDMLAGSRRRNSGPAD